METFKHTIQKDTRPRKDTVVNVNHNIHVVVRCIGLCIG